MEAVLEDFEKRNANNEDKSAVEAQRRYLGGDSDHSILVKGLDMALLEQNRTRAARLSTEDDDDLEQVFQDISSQATVSKKRTREDLIQELKEKRAQKDGVVAQSTTTKTAEEEAQLLEEAKKKGKFKPIGFKPVGPSEETAKNKKKKIQVDANGVERKKKRRKLADDKTTKDRSTNENATQEPTTTHIPAESINKSTASAHAPPKPEPEPEPEPTNFDIFAGAGEYEGIDLGDEDEEDGEVEESAGHRSEVLEEGVEPSPEVIPRRWIETDDEPPPSPDKQEALPSILKPHSLPQQREEEDDEQPMRLVPLASSALPSIKDFLAMDGVAGGRSKRKKRKGGKKEDGRDDKDSKKQSAEAKAERDYKRFVIVVPALAFTFILSIAD